MLKLVVLCFVAVIWLQLPTEGDAECCYSHKSNSGKRCDDCSVPSGNYCGVGGCNVFGCNCEGGCRTGDCKWDRWENGRRSDVAARIVDAHDVIRAADANGDGKMSLKEARRHLRHTGAAERDTEYHSYDSEYDQVYSQESTDYINTLDKRAQLKRLRKSIADIDVDNDKFLSVDEIDSKSN